MVGLPPRAATSVAQRAAFWDRMGSKRLMPGGLVWTGPGSTSLYLAIVASPAKDLVASLEPPSLTICDVFFDPAINARTL